MNQRNYAANVYGAAGETALASSDLQVRARGDSVEGLQARLRQLLHFERVRMQMGNHPALDSRARAAETELQRDAEFTRGRT